MTLVVTLNVHFNVHAKTHLRMNHKHKPCHDGVYCTTVNILAGLSTGTVRLVDIICVSSKDVRYETF